MVNDASVSTIFRTVSSATDYQSPSTSSSNGVSTVPPEPQESGEDNHHEDDHVELHDNDEANLFAEFDPTVESPGTWDPYSNECIPGKTLQQGVG